MDFLSNDQNKVLTLLDSRLRGELTSSQQNLLAKAETVSDPLKRWSLISALLSPSDSFDIHKILFHNNYKGCDGFDEVCPAYIPNESDIANTNIGKMMTSLHIDSYQDFYQFSIKKPEEFWHACLQQLQVPFKVPYSTVFDTTSSPHGVKSVEYLPNAQFNIVDACFSRRGKDEAALVYASEGDAAIQTVSFGDLDKLCCRIANGLVKPKDEGGLGLVKGDAVGICMPMTTEAVAVYFGIIKAGLAVVSIADSFSAGEIEMRMRIANAKAIFTQDVVYRRDKYLPLYTRVRESQQGRDTYIVILPGEGNELHSSVQSVLRPELDFSFPQFLHSSDSFASVICDANHTCNILFSSGTTGEPKAIPWMHSTPLKAAVDGFLHQDIHSGDVVCWPTNLGWMMGPWLLFQMINGGTIALFGGVTSTHLFCKFVESANVSMLGVVPSLVKAWQNSNATANCDWSCVDKFSSSGEASDPAAMHWLMSRCGGYKPVIEYCGGTEIAGSFLSSTMVQPNVPSVFSTPVLGSNILIINDEGESTEQGEVALLPPALGLSTHLLNRDHHQCYYADMPPGPDGKVLRRHGDEVQTLSWTSSETAEQHVYYRALGRCDDTMNIGGIKISSVEIERVCNGIQQVAETAAIGVSPPGGGPSILVIFAIIEGASSVQEAEKCGLDLAALKKQFQVAIKSLLNPLFHVGEVLIKDKLPRTASNKVMRRVLRDEYVSSQWGKAKSASA